MNACFPLPSSILSTKYLDESSTVSTEPSRWPGSTKQASHLSYRAPPLPLACATGDRRRMGPVESPHVALLAFPFGNHPALLLSLARALATSFPTGVVFSLLTSARSAASLSCSAFSSDSLNLRIVEISDGCPAGYTAPADDPEEEVRLFLRETPGNFKKGLEAAGGARVTCVVSDAFLWFAGELAEEAGAPWVALWTGGPCSLSAHLYTDLLRQKIIGDGDQKAFSSKGDEDLGFIPGLSGLRNCDLPEGIVSGDINGKFAQLLHRMGQELPRAAAVALNYFQGINPYLEADFASKFKKSFPVGPLSLLNPNPSGPDRFDCIQWLDRHEPASVAYIGFGTFVCLPPRELAELAEGLEASGVPFVWSLKEFAKEMLPVGFLDRTRDRGLVVPWAPQVQVLQHDSVGAFVTHCGWTSVLESVTCGVPMLRRPFLGDHMLNARAITDVWKVGVRFEGEGGLEKEAVAKALRKVLKAEEGRAMRVRIRLLKEMAVQSDGSSVRNLNELMELIVRH